MIVVNLFGVPSSGKSTAAAYVFYKLKELGVNCELVSEFAKDLVWDNNSDALKNQFYLAGNQIYRLGRLKDKVDVAITDSPLLLQPVYYKYNGGKHPDCFEVLIYNIDKEYNNMNYVLPMPLAVETAGRIHTEKDSESLYSLMYEVISKYGVSYMITDRGAKAYDKIVSDVVSKIEEIKNTKIDIEGEDEEWQ